MIDRLKYSKMLQEQISQNIQNHILSDLNQMIGGKQSPAPPVEILQQIHENDEESYVTSSYGVETDRSDSEEYEP